MTDSPEKWLRELGARRPMTYASDYVLVVGRFHRGFFNIMWRRPPERYEWCYKRLVWIKWQPADVWTHYGARQRSPLTKEDVIKFLSPSPS